MLIKYFGVFKCGLLLFFVFGSFILSALYLSCYCNEVQNFSQE